MGPKSNGARPYGQKRCIEEMTECCYLVKTWCKKNYDSHEKAKTTKYALVLIHKLILKIQIRSVVQICGSNRHQKLLAMISLCRIHYSSLQNI